MLLLIAQCIVVLFMIYLYKPDGIPESCKGSWAYLVVCLTSLAVPWPYLLCHCVVCPPPPVVEPLTGNTAVLWWGVAPPPALKL